MIPTLRELLSLDYFKNIEILTGETGLNNPFSDCGVLDYEYDQALLNKYFYTNFHENQLALTTFLYAKDNPYLILDAVKYLVQKKACGLAIKNVFRLPIHDSVIRYADSMNFPIILLPKSDFYFEDIIITAHRFTTTYDNDINYVATIQKILYDEIQSPLDIEKYAYNINPHFKDGVLCAYIQLDSAVSYDYNLIQTLRKQLSLPKSSMLLSYRNGYLLFLTKDALDYQRDVKEILTAINHLINSLQPSKHYIGISDVHIRLTEFRFAIKEALNSAKLAQSLSIRIQEYTKMGTYQFILPLVNTLELQMFSRSIINDIKGYDIENNTKLFETFICLAAHSCGLKEISKQLGQHENTLRYRFKQIQDITGLNYFNQSDYEQLSIAAKVHHASMLI